MEFDYLGLDDIDVEGIAEAHGYDILLDEDVAAYQPKGTYGYNPDALKRNTEIEEGDEE